MESGLKGYAFVTVRMNEFAPTIDFYTKLGFTQTHTDKEDVVFSVANEGYITDPAHRAYCDVICSMKRTAPEPGETGIRIKLSEQANLWEWVKQKQAEGIEFETPDVVETDWVYEIRVKDPTGNILTIFK